MTRTPHLFTLKKNYEKIDEREKLSILWKKYLDFDIKPEDIHCEGGN